MKKIYLLLLLGLSIWACRNTGTEPETGYDYFPLEKGNYVIYDVTQIDYVINQNPDTSRFQIKERVGDSFTALDGLMSYRIERYRRESEQQVWAFDSLWTARRAIDRAVRTENNVSFVKLIFPARNGQTWNPNILNTQDSLRSIILNEGEPVTIGTQTFDKTLTVQVQNKQTLTDSIIHKEVYAKTIGLIQSDITRVVTCIPDCAVSKISYGIKYKQRIVSHGKE
ncbi:hypothetical protein [Siphonobacter aquaeclarae]|uniref:Uncharacterized protein n=1 Tax=Siphonobacter aquaeclarae TaxID=563176 RepID=A0A1G9UBZ1_9BACT|nr:hypothetical protein [Siphonobacter aquaeclarae]SDM57353.1 hypothetical protein SAMN04488090_3758 [Siphonobacter aquaeclarae]